MKILNYPIATGISPSIFLFFNLKINFMKKQLILLITLIFFSGVVYGQEDTINQLQ